MKNRRLLSIFFLLSGSELWSHPSLLLTAEEIQSICANISNNRVEKTSSHSGILFLSAIIYVDETHWTIWVNNSRLRSDTSHDVEGFHVENVLPQSVTFSWTPPTSSLPLIFTLRPGQTYKIAD